jgi:Na+/H+ antiporter NhaA
VVLYVRNRRKVMALAPYLLIGAALWFFVLRSGVHATVAGVITAVFRADYSRPRRSRCGGFAGAPARENLAAPL